MILDLEGLSFYRPSRLGVWLGRRPIFITEPGEPPGVPELEAALPAFPGNDRVTKLKKVLFCRPVIWLIRHHLDQHKDVPRQTVVEMLRRRDSTVYNIVITGSSVQIASLENPIMAKHVLVSGHDQDVRFAGEIWCCKVDGEYLIFLSANSGTYRPGTERLPAATAYLATVFGVRVVQIVSAH